MGVTGRRVAPFDFTLATRTAGVLAVGLAGAKAIDALAHIGAPAELTTIGVVPIVPIVGAIAVAGALAAVRRAGEQRALEALGVSPMRVARGAVAIAIGASSLAALSILSGMVAVDPMFPKSPQPGAWRVNDGSTPGAVFVAPARGLAVDSEGKLSFVAAATSASSRTATSAVDDAAATGEPHGATGGGAPPSEGADAARRPVADKRPAPRTQRPTAPTASMAAPMAHLATALPLSVAHRFRYLD